eukprot:GFUD01006080.1.p1 GENE.GFUD01006080.1~~GFUD01006080.1.p1  ORF type:complete len:354 (+),score=96.54 GFUD01006080.1:149-1210(+)
MKIFLLFTILPVLISSQLQFPDDDEDTRFRFTTRRPTRPTTTPTRPTRRPIRPTRRPTRPTRRTTGPTRPTRPSTGQCGKRITLPKIGRFVVGGRPAQVGEFPWAVLALRSDGSSCGGSLLSDRYVLSAAHCHDEGVSITRVRVGVTRVEGGEQDTYKVRRRGDFTVGDPQVVEVSNVIVHPDYRKDSHGVTLNDLVLLELKTPVTFGPLVQPVCLPSGDQLARGISTVVGWGAAYQDDLSAPHVSSQNHLQVAALDILSDAECIEAYKKIDPLKEDSGIRLNPQLHLCAGRQVGVDSCNGDSGGPLIVQTGAGRRSRSYLVGVVSGGPECAKGFAGYYARMSNYVQWIKQYV